MRTVLVAITTIVGLAMGAEAEAANCANGAAEDGNGGGATNYCSTSAGTMTCNMTVNGGTSGATLQIVRVSTVFEAFGTDPLGASFCYRVSTAGISTISATGTGFADTLRATYSGSAAVYLSPGASALTLNLYGGSGSDTFYGSVSTSTSFTENLYGEGDVDTIYAADGYDDNLYGGEGGDYLYGEGGDDYCSGGNAADTIVGGPGDDTLDGDAGNDFLKGSEGADTLNGGTDNDDLFGWDNGSGTGSGTDLADTLNGGDGDDDLYGESGADTLNGDANIDTLYGGAGGDTLNGGSEGDTIYGCDSFATCSTDDVDTIRGSNGDDVIYGEAGGDLINGGDNNDIIDGGGGADVICGGNGSDELDDGDSSTGPLFDEDQLWGSGSLDVYSCGSVTTDWGAIGGTQTGCGPATLTSEPASCPRP